MVPVEFVVVLVAVLVLVLQRLLAGRRAPVRILPLLTPVAREGKLRPAVGALLPGPRTEADQPEVILLP